MGVLDRVKRRVAGTLMTTPAVVMWLVWREDNLSLLTAVALVALTILGGFVYWRVSRD